uniref:PHR domain-containing protein n=1 Tax=Vombatus ursinus TaxID=29139 RepID=A0A4X2LFT2_VOMUR
MQQEKRWKPPLNPFIYVHSLWLPTQGPDSHYGTKGLRKVIRESPTTGAKTCFTFCYAAGNNNGTSVEDGQIPEIIFYT